ncbi:hypothetical protein RB153_13645 [Paenibacillus larvae]|uniref:hypothetical protein n=1 Tax=Paenibacillus larvae TaxID=1464 RepID=UPI0028538B83|nr:hypothetical protein [Paenibacillus larvae]MDR5596467.1 hypothetical protein [Paenibacillus larvae]
MEAVVPSITCEFFKGMQQKSMIIAALLVKADLYLIDEPFIGLDPHANQPSVTIFERRAGEGSGDPDVNPCIR